MKKVSVKDFLMAHKKAVLYGWYFNVVIPDYAYDGKTTEEANGNENWNDFMVEIGDDDLSCQYEHIEIPTAVEYAQKGGWWDECHLRELDESTRIPNWYNDKCRDEQYENMKNVIVPILVKYGYLVE